MGGQILGDRYEVEQQLGKKSGRWTLKALDLQTQERVILKLIFLDDNLPAEGFKLFQREIEVLKSLAHPATPTYLDYFEIELPTQDRAMVLVQSYIAGISLRTYLDQGQSFSEADVIAIARQVLQILHNLHTLIPPLVHRDIRPSNIILQPGLPAPTAQVFLVDFGTVKFLHGGITSMTMFGSDGYLSPEQAAGRVLAISDLYSLGATLAACLTGLAPSDMQTKGLRIQFEDHVTLTPAFATWLKRLLAPGLDQRWASAQAALTALTEMS